MPMPCALAEGTTALAEMALWPRSRAKWPARVEPCGSVGWPWVVAGRLPCRPDDPSTIDRMADVAEPGVPPLGTSAYDRKLGVSGRWPFRTASRSQGLGPGDEHDAADHEARPDGRLQPVLHL